MNASGAYERIEYLMNGVLFSLDGSTSFSVQESDFENFFQTFTYSGNTIDDIGGVYEIRLVHNMTLDFGNVDSVNAYVVPFGKSVLVASIINKKRVLARRNERLFFFCLDFQLPPRRS